MAVAAKWSCTADSPQEHPENTSSPVKSQVFRSGDQKYSFFKSAAKDSESQPSRVKSKIL